VSPDGDEACGQCASACSIAMAGRLHAHDPVKNTVCRFLGLIIATSIAVGCSGSASPTLSSANGSQDFRDALLGTWNLLSIQPAGQAEQPKPDGVSYALTLADGRLSTRVDCNSCSGAFTLSGSTLSAGPALACTRAACPTMAFENTYTGLLSGDSAVTASGNTLVLSSPRGVVRFAR
jgi:heat shock protein HslJ